MPAKFVWTDEILDRLAGEIESGRAIYEIAANEKWCPDEATIYRAIAREERVAERIAKARAAQQEREIDQMVKMADEATVEDREVVKLRIWARQWRAGKLAPRKYGDKAQIEHSGPNGGPIQTQAVTIDLTGLELDELEAMQALLQKINKGA